MNLPLDAASLDAASLDAAPLDAAPLDAASLDAAPLDAASPNALVLDALPMGVIVLDRHGCVVHYNRAEETMARRRREDVIGRHFFDEVARCANVPHIRQPFEQQVDAGTLDLAIEHVFPLPFLPRPRDVRLHLRSLATDGEPRAMIVIEDLTLQSTRERQRQRVLKLLAHDLRNSLGGVTSGSELLLKMLTREPFDDRGASRMLSAMSSSATSALGRLEGAISDMAGGHRSRHAVNLHALILSTVNEFLPRAVDRGLRMTYNQVDVERAHFPDRAVAVRGYEDRLAAVVQNLVHNAFKYAGSHLDIRLIASPSTAVFEVADDGRGIEKEFQERVFEAGFQAPDSLPGEGVGLFAVRQMVQEHGGSIALKSTPGQGTTVHVELPVMTPESADDGHGNGIAGDTMPSCP